VLASVASTDAQDAWVLWRHFLPEKLRLDSSGRAYRIEYRCLPDSVDPRGPKGK